MGRQQKKNGGNHEPGIVKRIEKNYGGGTGPAERAEADQSLHLQSGTFHDH